MILIFFLFSVCLILYNDWTTRRFISTFFVFDKLNINIILTKEEKPLSYSLQPVQSYSKWISVYNKFTRSLAYTPPPAAVNKRGWQSKWRGSEQGQSEDSHVVTSKSQFALAYFALFLLFFCCKLFSVFHLLSVAETVSSK